MISMTKGDRIRDLRIARKITQSEMAQKLNTTKQTISKYEKGIVTNIPSDRIEDMARILDTTPEYILGWETEKEKPNDNDGLSKNKHKLIEFARTLPEDKAALALRLLQSIVEDGE